MSTWILPVNADQHAGYYFDVDGAFETLKTIFWGQSNAITNIAVGDIVYLIKCARSSHCLEMQSACRECCASRCRY